MKLPEKLTKLLNENNLTIAELSRYANIPDSTIRSIYKVGYGNIKLSTLKKLAEYFNVSIDYLVDEDIEQNKKVEIIKQYTNKLYTPHELDELDNYAKFLLQKRKYKK